MMSYSIKCVANKFACCITKIQCKCIVKVTKQGETVYKQVNKLLSKLATYIIKLHKLK